jgi:hypothetical protein
VLVRLSRISHDMLKDLLDMSYKFVTRSAAPRSPARRRGSHLSDKMKKA